jgi:carboxymethylenebutenolidase
MGEMIEFTRPDGRKAPAYYTAPPEGEHAPGVVVLEEWWGITDYMRQTADNLAAAGFRVLVPDLFRGRTAAVGDEANHLMQGLDFADAANQDARGAAQHLLNTGSKRVGVMGFCMGGALTMLSAMYVPEFSAAVDYYGFPLPEAGDPGRITIPFQGHWALHDEFFPISRVDDIEARFKEAHVPYEFYRYEAEHAFHNPNQPGQAGLGHYNQTYAEQAWRRSIDFLKKHLQS